jgi:predicted negative regulator of RcsB-dependent stress response
MPTLSSSDPILETQVFWERHRTEVFAVLIFVIVALAGYGGYRLYSEYRSNAGAALLATAKTSADYQKVIANYSSTAAGASAYLFLGEEQRKEKKFNEANVTLQAFVDKHPKHQLVGTARLAMGGNLESLGKRDEALTMYQRLAASDPQSFIAPVALMSTVHILKEKNQIEEARKVCETILTQYRESMIAGEATRQLRLLKGGNETAQAGILPVPGTPPEPTAAAAPPQSALPSAAAPPVPSASKPAASPDKKP